MKRNFLLLAVMNVAILFFATPAWAQCPADTNDLGICDTLYVETFDCDHMYDASPGSFDSVRVAIYVTHDSNTFWYASQGKWVQDSIRSFVAPLAFWHQPPGCADSVIFPNWDNWNNTVINPNDPRMSRSMFRHIVDEHTGDTTYNRMLQMVESGKQAWEVVTDIESHSSDGDSGHVFLALLPTGQACQSWWEGSRELLATLTFHVYMSDTCDATEIGLDSTFWTPYVYLFFVRYDAVYYVPRHFLPVIDTIYRAGTAPPVVSDIPDQAITQGQSFASINLDNYVDDPDNADDEMNWTYWGNVALLVSIANRVVTITVPNPSWSGSETIWFKACDPGALCDSNAATFTVLPGAPGGLTYIPNVPDWNQPPLSGSTNYCAPVAALNIVETFDNHFPFMVRGLVDPADSQWYTINRDSSYTADLIGWFMGTNGAGSPDRANNPLNPVPGTYHFDQDTGLAEYIAWDSASLFPTPTPLPPWKVGWDKARIRRYLGTDSALWLTYVAEIDSGRPVKVDFDFWNPVLSDSFVDTLTQDTFYVYAWGKDTCCSGPDDPDEGWDPDIGHAVTGVGYIPNWNGEDWAIVHDNWPTTRENVVIPWDSLMAIVTVYPPRLQISYDIDHPVLVIPNSNHCVISSYDYLHPPGGMGIWSLSHGKNLYFPSDSIAPPGDWQAWLTPGVHLARVYGPANVNIPSNPIVTIPDRNANPCTLFVEVPPANLIDQATDSNAIRISSGETTIIPINDTVETMVFLASCDGDYYSSPDQPLEVQLHYDDGTTETLVFDSIHPAGRGDITNPEEIFIYGNEVFVCNPAYFDDPSPSLDPYHSETWHWYALYPDNAKLLESITFMGIQSGEHSEIYILALSYSTPLPLPFIRGDANGDGVIDIGDIMHLINYLFIGGSAPDPLWVGDANCDGQVDVADVMYLINYLFIGGSPPCGGKGTGSVEGGFKLQGHRSSAQVGFSSVSISEDGVFNVPMIGTFNVDVAGVQLEIKHDAEEITLLEPTLTPRSEGLTVYSSCSGGIQKIGIVGLTGQHYMPAGNGVFVNLRVKGSDLNSLEISKAILVDRDAQKIPVNIVSDMKKSEEALVAGKPVIPQEFSLSQNYPNPFNPHCEIRYALPKDAEVNLSVYNLLGQKVKTLVDELQAAGHKTIRWDATDDTGNKVASGVYFYRIQADEFTQAKKMILMK